MNRWARRLGLVSVGALLGFFVSLAPNLSAQEKSGSAIPLAELRTFSEIFEKIKTDYVDSVDDTKLLRNAIRGMLAGLDAHSAYLVPDDYKVLALTFINCFDSITMGLMSALITAGYSY